MIEVEWQRGGFPSKAEWERFQRTRAWIERTQLQTINEQVALLLRCGLKLYDIMIAAWPDGSWNFAMQPHAVEKYKLEEL